MLQRERMAQSFDPPAQRRGRDVVIYDGACPFCTAQVRWLGRLDVTGRLELLSLHDETVPLHFPELGHDQLMQEMHVVSPAGRVYRGADAFRYLSRRLPLLWPLMPLLHLPGALSIMKWVYRWVATRRYRLSHHWTCPTGTCPRHR